MRTRSERDFRFLEELLDDFVGGGGPGSLAFFGIDDEFDFSFFDSAFDPGFIVGMLRLNSLYKKQSNGSRMKVTNGLMN